MKQRILASIAAALAILAAMSVTSCTGSALKSNEIYLLVGSYTRMGGGPETGSEGIYVFALDTVQCQARQISVTPCPNPSYAAPLGDGSRILAVSEMSDTTAAAKIYSFNAKSGKLKLLSSTPTGGADPCFITADPELKAVYTANYTGGSLTQIGLTANGFADSVALKQFSTRWNERTASKDSTLLNDSIPDSHIHCVTFSPDGRYMFATDLGKDMVYRFTKNEGNPLGFNIEVPDGAFGETKGNGPRHFCWSPNGNTLYIANEIGGSVTVWNYSNGNISQIQEIDCTFLGGSKPKKNGVAAIMASPDGKFLYVSNRLVNDGIAIFSIDSSTGKLLPADYCSTGKHPRCFALTKGANLAVVACRDDNSIEIYRRDAQTGALTKTTDSIRVNCPSSVLFIHR
jgi:6-phosphogluconolactonase